GALPYYSGLYTLDYYGLNDAEVAAQRMRGRSRIGHEHYASPEYMLQKSIDIYDVTGQIVHKSKDRPRAVINRAWVRVDKLNRGSEILTVQCRYANGRFLIYATTLSEEEHERRFANLDFCTDHFDKLKKPAKPPQDDIHEPTAK
ncbi:MAG: hypothetical protein HN348_35345, partial [Proteobacteria bacterium]|nr:hypothetical protein [Pseudomonadota bacterium]